jgi:hypothetical protein
VPYPTAIIEDQRREAENMAKNALGRNVTSAAEGTLSVVGSFIYFSPAAVLPLG